LVDGNPLIEYLPWEEPSQEVARRIWPKVVRESAGIELPVDYMVSRPWLFWRSTFVGARHLIEKHKKTSFTAAVYSSAPFDWTKYEFHPFTFCDLETLYYYGANFGTGKYHLAKGVRPTPFKDYWSHTPFEQVQPELDKLLRA
jgi:hypothetical protein